MKTEVVTRIASPIDHVWKLVAEDFTSIAQWSASVVTSTPLEPTAGSGDAPMGGRYCTFTDDPEGFGAKEDIIRYDAEAHILEFLVEPVNAPAAIPLKRNRVVVELEALADGGTQLRWTAYPELKAHGKVLFPLVKVAITKSFRGIVDELKAHAEGKQAVAA